MTTYATNNELEVLKAQMQVLKNHLADKEVISKEMIDATIRCRVKSLTSKRATGILSMAVIAAMAIFFGYQYFSAHQVSTLFFVVTMLWFLICGYASYKHYALNLRENLMDGDLTVTAQYIAKWKKTNADWALYGSISMSVWCGFCLYETWGELVANPKEFIFVAIIWSFVLLNVVPRWVKVNRVTTELLQQIDELKNH